MTSSKLAVQPLYTEVCQAAVYMPLRNLTHDLSNNAHLKDGTAADFVLTVHTLPLHRSRYMTCLL